MLNHFSHVQLFVTLWTVARQAPLSLRFSRQEYWSGVPGPPSGDLADPGIEPMSLMSPALAGGLFIRFFIFATSFTGAAYQIPFGFCISVSYGTKGIRRGGIRCHEWRFHSVFSAMSLLIWSRFTEFWFWSAKPSFTDITFTWAPFNTSSHTWAPLLDSQLGT